MNKTYIVRLSDEERSQLTELTRKGKAVAYKIGLKLEKLLYIRAIL
jgi:hypothetical protein